MLLPLKAVLLTTMMTMAAAVAAQDAPPNPTSAPVTAPSPAPAPAYADLIHPAADSLRETVSSLRIEKWKSGNVREEAARDAGSILDDLDKALPGLVKDADASPGHVGGALPLSRNLAALYDVSLRLLDAARIAGTSDQATKMQDAVNILGSANKAVYDRMASAAAAQEKRITDLQVQLKTQTDAAQAAAQQSKVVPDCPAPAVKKAVRKKKAPAKSAATQPGSATQKPQ